ncbi:MAG TPA: carboxypeptidase regulatory-like domain-containing protein, partial [Blastocatellia bacterium]|nr:carboxypeptidase regulatory-like domain-containing protein [Blastocatellia bacterium]
MRKIILLGFALLVTLSISTSAQNSQLSGTIKDSTGASIAGAEIELTDIATNQSRKVTTNEAGQYTFPSVLPGEYKVTATMKGFRQAVIQAFKVDVGKNYDLNLTLEIGSVGEVVEVTAGIGAELQKTDATVGNVISGEALKQIPNLNRDTTSLILLQPMVSPAAAGTGDNTGGQVAGARGDQNTFMLDGGDATSNTEATGGYNSGFVATPRGVVPTPAESLEEFRVATNNSGATFARSAGAQVAMVTKRGTNELHGSLYWYHQNDALNAASWTNKRTLGQTITDPTRRHKVQEPELKDNRYGFSLGGPIWKDKTFIFGHYEGRRFPQTGQRLRNVPTDTLKQGILRFRDAANNIVSYNLATSTACLGGACDPRNRGISPVVRAVWDLLPAGNDPSAGDGLNFIGYRANIPFTLKEEFAVARLDHNFNEKWRFDGAFRYGRTRSADLSQIDITKGANKATAERPLEPRYMVAGLTGQITSTLISETRFNFLRHWWEWATFKPAAQVSGTNAALAIAGEGLNSFIDEPINVDTQNARGRIWNGKDYNFTQNFTWIKGGHNFNFGGKYLNQNFFHQRDDKVVGGLTSLVYQIENGNFAVIPAANRPATCGGGVTTNCIQSADIANWDKLYAATLGIMDRAAVLLTRDGDLKPQAPGVPLRENVNVKAYEFYGADTWRFKPSLTFSYGVNWNIQQPPTEAKQKQTLLTADGNIIETKEFLARRKAAAEAGQAYNPRIGVLPLAQTGRKYVYDPDYNNIGPRIAAAWSPSFNEGFMGKVFGTGKTVIRGGYSLSYDRINGVGIVMIPILGIGYGNVLSCTGPTSAGACSGAGTNPTNAFRIGIDGSSVPLPTVSISQVPIIPGLNGPGTVAGANSVFETLSFQIDARRKVAHNHSFDLTWQRELGRGIVVEAGYVGRAARGLYQGLDLNQVPIFMKGQGTNQTFAQAYDEVARAVRTGTAVTAQPWFENMLRGSSFCAAPNTSCTAGVVSRFSSQINLGQVYTLFANLNNSFVTGPVLSRNQVEVLYMITDLGRSNYHAGFISLQKRSKNATVGFNYTL